jgi:hypothetical protein
MMMMVVQEEREKKKEKEKKREREKGYETHSAKIWILDIGYILFIMSGRKKSEISMHNKNKTSPTRHG